MRKKQLKVWSALLAIILLCSCLKKEAKESDAPSSAGSSPAAQSSTRPISSPAASIAPTTTSAPAIAEANGETPGTKVEVQELKRGGNSVMLKFTLINDANKALDFGYNFGDKENQIRDFNTVGGITLVDSVGKKKYFVVRDSDNACVCSSNLKDLPPKGRMSLWAKFPPPPDDVQKISIIVPHFSPMDDVAISR